MTSSLCASLGSYPGALGLLVLVLMEISMVPTCEKSPCSLTRLLSRLEHHLVHQKFAGLIPGQSPYLDCRFDHWLGGIPEATDPCFLSH